MNSEYAIEVSHLTKKFGKNLAVDDISFQVRRGEVFGLLGPNGAGKTTTLRMITTLLKQTSGQITVFGHNTLKDSKAARATFGLTGQYASVDEDISARENLLIFSRLNGLTHVASKQRATELLEEFSLTESADKPIADFSGGMRRRLDLAVSLITRPSLIFLDEPTTGLDPRTRSQMWETIRNLVDQGSTIVLTTQYLDEADELADRVAVIDHGKLVKIGAPAALKQQVGSSTLQLSLTDEHQLNAAQTIVTNQLHTSTKLSGGATIMAKLKHSDQVADVLIGFQKAGIALNRITVQEPTLDDVFFNLTIGTN